MTGRTAALWLCALLAFVTSCTGVPDRSREARQLQDAVAAMPGVKSASFSHENGGDRGASIYADIWMPDATQEQFRAVVTRINELRGNTFDGYYQRLTFQPATNRGIEVPCGSDALDATAVTDQAIALRRLASRITIGSAEATCGTAERRMTLRDNETPIAQVLKALQSTGADLASVEIMGPQSAGMAPFSSVAVTFPFSGDDWSRFLDLVSRMDGKPWLAGLGPGSAINGLGVAVRSPASAYQQLSNVIAEVGAGPQHPMYLSWALEGPQPRDGLRFWGTAGVGECRYGNPTMGDEHPENYYTPESIETQKRMRAQYDTCAK